MTDDPLATAVPVSVGRPLTAPSPAGVSGQEAERQQIKNLAQEFEAILVTQMLREMRKSMLSDESAEGGLGNDTMTDAVDIELGRALSRVGGFGLSGVLEKAISVRGAGAGTPFGTFPVPVRSDVLDPVPVERPTVTIPPTPEDPASEAMTPGGTSSEDGLTVPGGPISSGYGWRRDPFTGVPQFHRGIDVAQPYGREVKAAAAGRVVFAGDRGDYGTMVVVEHTAGQQTRYAHLSAIGVRVGDAVEGGQAIGRSGDSGRSMGPHLHFEVLAGGQAVDPATEH